MHLRQFIRVCERQGGYLQACRHTAKISDAGFLCFLTETGKSPASIANTHMTPIIFMMDITLLFQNPNYYKQLIQNDFYLFLYNLLSVTLISP